MRARVFHKTKVIREDDLHKQVADMLEIAIGPPGEVSSTGLLWYSVEVRNAGGTTVKTKSGSWIPVEAIRRKRCGCISGVPDVHFFYRGHTFLMELKTESKGSVLNPGQRKLHCEYKKVGVIVEVARSLEEVLAFLAKHRLPLTHEITLTAPIVQEDFFTDYDREIIEG